MSSPRLHTVDEAAPLLALTPDALRALCRRNARLVGKRVVADLASGITALKLGRLWRVQFEGVAAILGDGSAKSAASEG